MSGCISLCTYIIWHVSNNEPREMCHFIHRSLWDPGESEFGRKSANMVERNVNITLLSHVKYIFICNGGYLTMKNKKSHTVPLKHYYYTILSSVVTDYWNKMAVFVSSNFPVSRLSHRGRLCFTVKMTTTVSACLWTDSSCPWSEVPHADLVLASNAKMIGYPLCLWSNKSSTLVSSCSPFLALTWSP